MKKLQRGRGQIYCPQLFYNTCNFQLNLTQLTESCSLFTHTKPNYLFLDFTKGEWKAPRQRKAAQHENPNTWRKNTS